MTWFGDGMALALAALFAVALVHKLFVLRSGLAERDQLLRSGPFGASLNAGAAALLEASTLLALAVARGWGLLAAALLLSAYAWALRGLERDQPCHCFGASSRTRAGVARWRNAGLALLAGVGALATLGADRSSGFDAVALALLVLAAIAAFEALDRLAWRTTTIKEKP